MLTTKKNLFDDYGVSKLQKSVDPRTRRLQLEKEFFEAADNLRRKTEALLEIKRDKLYQQVCETWKEYCDQILGKSVAATRLQFRALEIEDERKKSSQCDEPALSEKDLRKMARLPDQEVKELLNDEPEVVAKKIAAKKVQKPSEFRKAMPDELRAKRWADAMAKLRAAEDRDEEGFLETVEKMLEDWGL